jgi:hypothetical protein
VITPKKKDGTDHPLRAKDVFIVYCDDHGSKRLSLPAPNRLTEYCVEVLHIVVGSFTRSVEAMRQTIKPVDERGRRAIRALCEWLITVEYDPTRCC